VRVRVRVRVMARVIVRVRGQVRVCGVQSQLSSRSAERR